VIVAGPHREGCGVPMAFSDTADWDRTMEVVMRDIEAVPE
jgi:hypothetical protein